MCDSMGTKVAPPDKMETPGPGVYNLPSKMQESPGKTIGSRYKEDRDNRVPGPGSYKHDKAK